MQSARRCHAESVSPARHPILDLMRARDEGRADANDRSDSVDPLRAAASFDSSIELLAKIDAGNELALAYAGRGRLDRDQGDFDRARESLARALAIFERLRTPGEPARMAQELAALPPPLRSHAGCFSVAPHISRCSPVGGPVARRCDGPGHPGVTIRRLGEVKPLVSAITPPLDLAGCCARFVANAGAHQHTRAHDTRCRDGKEAGWAPRDDFTSPPQINRGRHRDRWAAAGGSAKGPHGVKVNARAA